MKQIQSINCNYKTKGIDLYDYIFYLSKNINVNLELLREKLVILIFKKRRYI